MSEKIGGDRVKQETVATHQIWQRKSGTHFIILGVGYAIKPIIVSTLTIETRKTQRMQLSTLLSGRHAYVCVGNLRACRCCKRTPRIRYGEFDGEPRYNVSCDCLEFDGTHHFLDHAIRAWKGNMKHLDPTSRCRPNRKGIVEKAKAGA